MITLFEYNRLCVLMQTDARLLGLGGVFHDNGCTKMFHCAIPASWSGHHICIYELLAIFIGLRVWGPILQDKRLHLFYHSRVFSISTPDNVIFSVGE
jgi:hypothetical protein